MRSLVVEDDFVSRRLLMRLLSPYGFCDVATDGVEALSAFEMALEARSPYHLVCLDILMPKMDGQETLGKLRALEEDAGLIGGQACRVIMTTGLEDGQSVLTAFRNQCDAYLTKPIVRNDLVKALQNVGLMDAA